MSVYDEIAAYAAERYIEKNANMGKMRALINAIGGSAIGAGSGGIAGATAAQAPWLAKQLALHGGTMAAFTTPTPEAIQLLVGMGGTTGALLGGAVGARSALKALKAHRARKALKALG